MGLKKYFIKNKTGAHIEAEEIFMDAKALEAMEEKGKMERPIRSCNFVLFYCFVLVCLIGLAWRAGHLQVAQGGLLQRSGCFD